MLLRTKPDALQRVCPIAGDCLDPDLGISQSDQRILTAEVQIVIHGAATVRFDEALHISLAINVRATRLMLQLAKQMTQLVSFVHVSTAYSNCVVHDIAERFYPEHLNCSSDKILAVGELVSNKLLDAMEPSLVGSFPNTYTYTKALAEDVILREAGNLPLSIFRPAISKCTRLGITFKSCNLNIPSNVHLQGAPGWMGGQPIRTTGPLLRRSSRYNAGHHGGPFSQDQPSSR